MNCSELKDGQVLLCEGCGFELEVVKECGESCCTTDTCCTGDIVCCEKPMTSKQ